MPIFALGIICTAVKGWRSSRQTYVAQHMFIYPFSQDQASLFKTFRKTIMKQTI
jgi:hypothetical protein